MDQNHYPPSSKQNSVKIWGISLVVLLTEKEKQNKRKKTHTQRQKQQKDGRISKEIFLQWSTLMC